MTPGPTLILQLPNSQSVVRIGTIGSGNTFGARQWTDGKMDAPMLPDSPWLRVHPGTGELFWTDECKELFREEDEGDTPAGLAEAPFAEEPELSGYERALAEGLGATVEKERYIRMRCWWLANDPVREGQASAPAWAGWSANLQRFRSLLDLEDPEQRIMAAEAARELGDFDTASELMRWKFPEGYYDIRASVMRQIMEGNCLVHEVKIT